MKTQQFNIPKSVLEYHLKEGFKIKDIASMLSVSESIVYRRMRSYGLSALDFSDICDDELDYHLSELSRISLLWRGIDELSSTRKGYQSSKNEAER